MICVKCGAEVPDLPFCGACGWKQEKAPPVKHKRGNGQGSVYKLPNGKYKAVVILGYYSRGQRFDPAYLHQREKPGNL